MSKIIGDEAFVDNSLKNVGKVMMHHTEEEEKKKKTRRKNDEIVRKSVCLFVFIDQSINDRSIEFFFLVFNSSSDKY